MTSGYESGQFDPVHHLCTGADRNHIYKTKILMFIARLCQAKKKTETSSQKSLGQNVILRLSLRDGDRALGQLEAGRHADDVAADFGCHVSTIYRLL